MSIKYGENDTPAPSGITYGANDKPVDQKTALGDLGRKFKSGVEQLPGMVTGLADIAPAIATGTRPFTAAADYLGSVTGFTPGKWAKEIQYSDANAAGAKNVDEAWSGIDAAQKDPTKTKSDVVRQALADAPKIADAYIRNPGYTAGQIAESVPSMLAGGAASKGAMLAGRAAGVMGAEAAGAAARAAVPGYLERTVGEKLAAPVAAGLGEGAVTAGQQMDNYQGEDQRRNALGSLAAGVGTGAIGAVAGRLSNKMGLETAETAMAKAGDVATGAAEMSAKRRILGGMVSEAVLQELPQSAQEQVWQNYAEGKPLMEGVLRQGVEGALAGAVMGAGANLRGRSAAPAPTEQPGQEPAAQAAPELQPQPPAPEPLAAGFTPGTVPATPAAEAGRPNPASWTEELWQASEQQKEDSDYYRDQLPRMAGEIDNFMRNGGWDKARSSYGIGPEADAATQAIDDAYAVLSSPAGAATARQRAAAVSDITSELDDEIADFSATPGVAPAAPIPTTVESQSLAAQALGNQAQEFPASAGLPTSGSAQPSSPAIHAGEQFQQNTSPLVDQVQPAEGPIPSTPGLPQQSADFAQKSTPSSTPLNSLIVADQAVNAEAAKRANRLAAVGVAEPMPNSPLTNAALAAVDSGAHGAAMAERQAAKNPQPARTPLAGVQPPSNTQPGAQTQAVAQTPLPRAAQPYPLQADQSTSPQSPLARAAAATSLADTGTAPAAQNQTSLIVSPSSAPSKAPIVAAAPTPQERIATLRAEVASGLDAKTGAKLTGLQPGIRKAQLQNEISKLPREQADAIRAEMAAPTTPQPTQQEPAYVPELQNPEQKASPAPGAQGQTQDAQGVAPAAPPQELTRAPEIAIGPARVLQNRDRSSAANINQMNSIAKAPDYKRAGQSPVMEVGAPLVFGSAPAGALVGKSDEIADGLGQRVPVQYAVVESADVLPSHQADGTPIAEYETGIPGKLRPVAGNGRAAGISAGYGRNTAATYRQELIDDAPSMGIDPAAVAAMRAPVLVRVMPEELVTDDIGDRSNIRGTADLSPAEQAANDTRRIDIKSLEFNESGMPDPQSIARFVQAMSDGERNTLIQPDGITPTRQLIDRITSAAFKAAYGNDRLVQLQAQSTDTEIRNIITAMAIAAGPMANLEGAGDFDIRGAVAEAAQIAVNAKNAKVTLTEHLNNGDFLVSGEAFTVAAFMADNIRSSKRMADGLRAWAAYAAEQAAIVRENETQGAMFGPTPTADRATTFNQLGAANDQSSTTQIQDGASRVSRVEDRAPRQETQPDAGQNLTGDFEAKSAQDAEVVTQQPEGVTSESSNETQPQQAQQETLTAAVPDEVARPASWRKNRLQAGAVARKLGIDAKGMSLAEVVAAVERADAPAQASQAAPEAQPANEVAAPAVKPPKAKKPTLRESVAQAKAAREAITPANDKGIGRNSDGETLHQRSDGSIYRMHNGRPDFGGDLVPFATQTAQDAQSTDSTTTPGQQASTPAELEQARADLLDLEKEYKSARGQRRSDLDDQITRMRAAIAERDPVLTAPTPQDILNQQARAEAAAQAEKSQQRAADERARRERERKDIAKASESAADTFVLGGDAEQNLSGQRSVFDDPLFSRTKAASATRFSFTGERAATADTRALSTAKQRLDSGEDAEAVRQDTGWSQGADGKWRFEIGDENAFLKGGGTFYEIVMRRLKALGKYDSPMLIGDVLYHPPLFAAYPAIASTEIQFTPEGAKAAGRLGSDGVIQIKGSLPGDRALSVLLHEIQHAIQNVEGFATGGSMYGAADYQAQVNSELTSLLDYDYALDLAYKKWAKFQDDMDAGRDFDPAKADEAETELLKLPDGAKVIDLYGTLEGLADPDSAMEVMRDRYTRLSGEVESRNTQARQRMTPSQRRATSPESTADVKARDVIVTFNEKDAHSAPMPENASEAPARGRATGMTPPQIQAIVSHITANWRNAPEIVVAANMDDPRIPQAARDEDQRQRAMGATGNPEGFVHAGKVYLLADQLTSPERAAQVLLHESLGHIGLQGVFGDSLKTILQQIATMRRADVTAKAEQYGLDMSNAADRLTAAEEVLAEMAQAQPEIGFVKRAVAAIRTWLRANVPGFETLALTDAEIVRSYLLPARGFIERGAAAGVGGRAAFSRTEAPALITDIPNEGWLKNQVDRSKSKGRNAFGAPYMGSVTGRFKGVVQVDVKTLARLNGMNGEQNNPRPASLEWLKNELSKNSLKNVGEPYIEVGYDGVPWVSEGNHRIMAAQALGWKSMPVEIRYFDGGERVAGVLSPANPDIRFSRSPAADPSAPAWATPEKSEWFDDLAYKLQDKQIDTKRVVEAIRTASGALADERNVYLQESLYHGRAATRSEDFVNKELGPLVSAMRMRGLDIAALDEYLHARHAEEANALIAGRNPGIPDGGSGITTADARAYLAGLDAGQRAKLEAVAAQVDAILARTRQLYADYSLESQKTVDGWSTMFANYVPLMREDDGGGTGIGQGFSIKGRETRSRTGSTRKVVDILANIAMQRERAIVRGEKNRVATALVGLAEANPNKEFWHTGPPPSEKVYDAKLNKVVSRPDPMYKSRENVLMAKIKKADGTVIEKAVVFNEDSERAMRMSAALKNLDAAHLEGLLGVSAKVTRYFSAVNTQFNPIFGVVNLTRDVQSAILNLSSTPLKGKGTQVAKHVLSALAGVYQDARAARNGQTPNSPWAALHEEFRQEGGQTGFRDAFTDSNDRANAIRRELNPEAWMDSPLGKIFTAGGALKVPLAIAQKRATGLFGWLSDYNLAMENAVRLSAYKVAREQGMSRQQAASLAKELTVNFNRKGQIGSQAGALYAFFNASMQGTARLGETLFTMEPGKPKTLRLSATGRNIVLGGVTLGVLQAFTLAALGFDSEEPPDFVRERSLIVPTGWLAGPDKGYITIPMPLGLHVLPNMGRIPTEFALNGFKNPEEQIAKLLTLITGAFNPVGGGASLLQTLAPTPIDPLAALAENRDWTGKPIARTSRNPATPGHLLTKDTASYPAKLLAEAINVMSGGTEYVAGILSPTPDQIDYLWSQATGGVGREVSKAQQSVSTVFSGEDLPINKIPLAGRFYGNADTPSAQSNKFYSAIDRLNRHEEQIKGLRKDGRGAEVASYLAQNPEARLFIAANAAERQVQELRGVKRDLIKKDAPAERVKLIEAQIASRMTAFNEMMQRTAK